ncbi:MAG: endonuclease/exonuclease/phosphatase family metal-dependent hydrolase [Parasphingorhabdus sp.]|jgi:endonuclease/exonuclease/phosphatase family metal-dependent hydrolase
MKKKCTKFSLVTLLASVVFFVSGLFIAVEASEPTASTAQNIKVMVFNIEYGGEHIDFSQVIAAIQAADPDILMLEEADFNTKKVSDELGGSHPYYDIGMQIVSKYPLYEPHNSKSAYTFAEVAPGKVVAIANAHLDSIQYGPFLMNGANRLSGDEIMEIEKQVRLNGLTIHRQVLPELAAAGVPVFVGGDFNTPSHLDYKPEAVAVMQLARGEKNVFALEWPVSKALQDLGFRDSYRDIYPDAVAKPGLTWWAGKPFDPTPSAYNPTTPIQDRIDFLYTAGPSITLASAVVGEEGSAAEITIPDPWPSDHRGLVSTFSVTPQDMPLLLAIDQRFVTAGDDLTVTVRDPEGTEEKRIVLVAKGDSVSHWVADLFVIDNYPNAVFNTLGMLPGEYEAVLVDVSDKEYGRQHFTVKEFGARLEVYTDQKVYDVGDPVTVIFKNGPGIRWPWFDIRRKAGGGYYMWDYANYSYLEKGYTESGTLVPRVHDSVTITEELPAGVYTLRYFYNLGPVARIKFTVK